jgi:hypothetical protein
MKGSALQLTTAMPRFINAKLAARLVIPLARAFHTA